MWLRQDMAMARSARRGRQVVFYMPTAAPLLLGAAPAATGGAENQAFMVARELARRGHAVGIVAFDDAGALRARVDGVDVIPQPVPRTRIPIVRTLIFYAQTASTLFTNPARVFVQPAAGIYTPLVALIARVLGRRFVYSSAGVHDFDLGSWEQRRWIVWLFGIGVRSADEVVVHTPEQMRLCRARFGRDPVLIASIAEAAPRRVARPDAFLWIGRFDHNKRPLAYVELARAVPDARFRMIAVDGSPSEGARLAAEVERAGRELPNLELLAPRARAELTPLIDRAVAMVSTSHYEGMPNVLLEGWSRGVPALALSRDPDGVIEREGLGGYAGGDADRMADLARAMWQDRDDQEELADRCRCHVAREHAAESVADRWIEILELP
jgi:glycosyltransferase involved in cell wall biosynthesis